MNEWVDDGVSSIRWVNGKASSWALELVGDMMG